MRICCLCRKHVKNHNVAYFKIPKNEQRRKEWSEICGIQLTVNDVLCGDHFSSSDIIKGERSVSLAPIAMPFVCPVKSEKSISSTNVESNSAQDIEFIASLPEYVHINTLYNTASQKCRCCTNPSSNFTQLDRYVKLSEGMEKSYKDLLYEVTNLIIPNHSEILLPQQICLKCGAQLKSSYEFIHEACKVSEQYLKLTDQSNNQEDIKNIEHLQESLIEIAPIIENATEELKAEPLNMEYEIDVKEEKVESEIFMQSNLNNEISQEESTDDNSSEDEDSQKSELLKGTETGLNGPIAMCCDICHKVYSNEKLLKVHKRYTHIPEENKLPCPLCSYKASRTSALKVHMRLVHGHDKVNAYFKPLLDSNKKYPCSLCPHSYGRKDSLRKHFRRKHLNKSPKEEIPKKIKSPKPKEKQCSLCTYCGQSFNTSSGLKSHALTHTGERPFSCEICNKKFKRVKDLQLHRVIHSDEKPHQCSECGKAFKRADKLKIHMRVHSELRPYKCKECEKTFKYLSVLRTHMRTHTGQTPFSCKTCGETFSLKTSLNNHCLKNDHIK